MKSPSQKKKILFLITKATSGGAQRYVHDLVTNIQKSQFEPIVAFGTKGKLAEDFSRTGIKTYQLASLTRDIAIFSDIKSFLEIYRLLRELRPDIVHLNSSKAAALGAFAARLVHVPNIIFTVHGWPFKEDRNVFAKCVIYFVSWFTALLSHHVIVVSKKDENLARRMWGIAKKTHHIPLGIAPFQILPPHDGFRAMFGSRTPIPLQTETIRLVSIAELTANKGILYAIDAVDLLRARGIDAVYVIVGEGEEYDSLQSYVRRKNLDDRIVFTGFVTNAAANLGGFDVFLLPSLKEGMPYVLLEAAYAHIPIIATSVIDDVFMEKIPNTEIVPPKDAESIAQAITELSKLPRGKSEQGTLFELGEMIAAHVALYD